MYPIFITCVTVLTLTLPWWASKIATKHRLKLRATPYWLVLAAAICYAISGLLPDIHISRETNTFQEHFVGGGLFTGLLFIYLYTRAGWHLPWWVKLLVLFAWTSALGVLNELLEFAVTKLNLTHIDITDTSWDLAANTLGSLTVFAVWQLVLHFRKFRQHD